jgi:hypothetical protein
MDKNCTKATAIVKNVIPTKAFPKNRVETLRDVSKVAKTIAMLAFNNSKMLLFRAAAIEDDATTLRIVDAKKSNNVMAVLEAKSRPTPGSIRNSNGGIRK